MELRVNQVCDTIQLFLLRNYKVNGGLIYGADRLVIYPLCIARDSHENREG